MLWTVGDKLIGRSSFVNTAGVEKVFCDLVFKLIFLIKLSYIFSLYHHERSYIVVQNVLCKVNQ